MRNNDQWLADLTRALTSLTRVLSQPRQSAKIGQRSGVHLDLHLYVVFTRIGEYQPIHAGDLARYMELDRSTIGRAVSELIAADYVSRSTDPSDARNLLLRLTPTGEQALSQMWSAWHEELGQATDGWTNGERQLFSELLQRLGGALENQVWDGPAPWALRQETRPRALNGG